MKLHYSYDELLADRRYASRLRRGDALFHGGLGEDGAYVPPRSLHRAGAIAAWESNAAVEPYMPHPAAAASFFPSAEQAKLLLRHGASRAMTRILTVIGVAEGFGKAGMRGLPRLDLQQSFAESIEGTALAHLDALFDAHAFDSGGRGDELGHDGMWFAIRDAALDEPPITPDMFRDLPVVPPPGYVGVAEAAPEAISMRGSDKLMFTELDPGFETLLTALVQLAGLSQFTPRALDWAKEVLTDPECSEDPGFAGFMLDCLRSDSELNRRYLGCALAEARARLMLTTDGAEIPGERIVRALESRALAEARSASGDRMAAHFLNEIRRELADRSDGGSILARFATLGPVPEGAGPAI